MNRVRYGYAAAAWIVDYYVYNVRICLALLYPPQALTKTFKAAANSFCRLLRNWPKAVFLARSVATDLAVPIGHDAGFAKYLDQLTLVAAGWVRVVIAAADARSTSLWRPCRRR